MAVDHVTCNVGPFKRSLRSCNDYHADLIWSWSWWVLQSMQRCSRNISVRMPREIEECMYRHSFFTLHRFCPDVHNQECDISCYWVLPGRHTDNDRVSDVLLKLYTAFYSLLLLLWLGMSCSCFVVAVVYIFLNLYVLVYSAAVLYSHRDDLSSSSYRPEFKQSRPPRSHYTHHGEGKKVYMKEQEEKEEREQYLRTLETSRTCSLRVIERLRNFDEKNIDLVLVLELIKYISSSLGEGAILVFLPGWDTITKLNDMLTANPVFRGRSYLIIPLHSMMPTTFQQTVSYLAKAQG